MARDLKRITRTDIEAAVDGAIPRISDPHEVGFEETAEEITGHCYAVAGFALVALKVDEVNIENVQFDNPRAVPRTPLQLRHAVTEMIAHGLRVAAGEAAYEGPCDVAFTVEELGPYSEEAGRRSKKITATGVGLRYPRLN